MASDADRREHAQRLVVLLGHPVAHSLSPAIHNRAFKEQGLDMEYAAWDVPPEGLPQAVAGLRSNDVRGANVTIPHKQAVVPMMDGLSAQAELIGAVNTVVNERGSLVGHNTDAGGFAAALRKLIPEGPKGLSCLVVGSGGAARAVVASLVHEGCRKVWVANRTMARAEELCREASEWGRTEVTALGTDEANTVAPSCEMIVNTTPVGLLQSVKEFPVDVDMLDSGNVLMDLVYGAGTTSLVEAARARGIAAVDGKEMLVQQAALAYELWTGIEAPLKVMREIIDGH